MSRINGVDSMNMMHENPELRWSFIRKVYSILTLQLLLTIAVVSVVVFVPAVTNFVNNYVPNYVLCIVTMFALLLVEYYHQKKHLLSYFLLLIFTVSVALLVGSLCALLRKINLEAVVLTTTATAAMMFILILYTFWAVKKGQDFEFLNSFLLRALLVLLIIIPIQLLLPLEKLPNMIVVCSFMISGCLLFIMICGNIVYNTDTLIKRISYAKYISASISSYLDVIILFQSLCILYGVGLAMVLVLGKN